MRLVRPGVDALLARAALFLCALAAAGCNVLHAANRGPLPAVTPAATPHPPTWIASLGPRGSVNTLAQIRIEFKQALIPLESLESADEVAKLASFSVDPALAGRFRFLTPRLVGFQADEALPVATRVRVTMHHGLTDLRGDALGSDVTWTFNTEPLRLTTQVSSVDPVTLTPTLGFSSNAELDAASLAQTVSVVTRPGGVAVPVKVTLVKSEVPESDDAAQKFDPSLRDWYYAVVPARPLTKATNYTLVVAAGLLPAHGNLPLAPENALRADFRTFAPLAFGWLGHESPSQGSYRFADGDPYLAFNNPIASDSARTNIVISPSPKPWASLVEDRGDTELVRLDPAAFDPATHYVISIGAGLTDTFGQALGKAIAVPYDPGDAAASFWAPGGLNIFPSGVDLQLQFSAVNLKTPSYEAAYHVVQPAELVYADVTDESKSPLLDARARKSYPLRLQRNKPLDITVALRDKLGASTGMLAYGVDAAVDAHVNEYFGAVQLTNLGVFAQWFPASGIVRVHHLSDGSPSAGARVDVYRSLIDATSSGSTAPCATALTDGGGSASFGVSSLRACMQDHAIFNAPPRLLAVAHEGGDWSFARTDEWSGSYGYGIYAGWDDGTPQSRGTVFSDRALYQQGEDAWFAGAAYYLQNGVLHRDANTRYRLVMEDAGGKKTDLGIVATDAYGAFSRKVTIAANQPLGDYALHAKSAAGVQIDGSFRVAQFRPPNFKVALALDKQFAVAGTAVDASSSSTYLFGSPVQGGTTTFYVTRQQTSLAPKGWDDYAFGRQWYWPEQPPSVDTEVLRNAVTLGADGAARQRVEVNADLPYPMTYEVDAETTDVSNLSVADSKTFTALPDDRLIGLKADWIAKAGNPISVGVVVTDPAGSVLSGQQVHVELQAARYATVTQVVEGGESALDQVQYKTVAQTDVRTGTSSVQAALTPPAGGSYRIRANFAGARTDATASDTYLWVTGENQVYWPSENPDQLQVKLDKPSYLPGEWATALIQSPYADGELYFAVIRHDTIYHAVRAVHGGAPTVRFRVTADMLPNAAVEAVLVRTGMPLSKTHPGSVESLARVGFAPFDVRLDAKRLKVAVAPLHASVLPGGSQTLRLRVTDASGKPVRGELAVAVDNESVLQLSGYRFPDLISIVYADQDVSTRFADNRPNVVLAQPPSPIDKGWGFGGGFSAAAAGTRVRTNFRPLAYFNGAVRTDAHGDAAITFSVPDDLTTWRVLAVATAATSGGSADFRFGTNDATFVTSKPLVTDALLPQFARPGDVFEAGISVTNPSGKSGPLDIRGRLGGALRFDERAGPAPRATLQAALAPATQAYRFPVVAGSAGEARVGFATTGGGMNDAFEVSIPVVPIGYLEQVVESGVTGDRAAIPIAVDANARTDAGGLDVSLASTLLPEIVEPARDVLDTECLPFLEPAASQLAIAADVIVLQRKYGHVAAAFSPSRVGAQDVAYLAKLQLPSGGFAAWPGDKVADPTESAYAAQSLAAARSDGIAVNGDTIAALQAFLRSTLANPAQFPWCDTRECAVRVRLDALAALSALGETRDDFIDDIYGARDSLVLADRIRLARYLLNLPGWRAQGREMAGKFQEIVYETGRTATVNAAHQSWWADSLTVEQAQMLRLMMDVDAKPDFVDRMVEGLLALRRHGTWTDSYEDAQALSALIDYGATQSTPPDFDAAAALSTRPLLNVHFQGYTHPAASAHVPPSALARGTRDTLTLTKSGKGALHYFVSYAYALSGPQPGAIAGLRVLRYVRAANDATVLWQAGLVPQSAPLQLDVGRVFDVELEVIADHPVDNVVITDPLPAGFEAVDASFRTSTQFFQAATDSWQLDYQAIYRDRVVAYGDHLDAGDYSFHYLVRSVTPGTFSWPGAEVHLQYAPEIFGRTASGTLVLR